MKVVRWKSSYLIFLSASLFALINFLFPEISFSQTDPPAPPEPPPLEERTIYYEICQIRQLFCGDTALVIVAVAIFSVGMMTFMGKLTWTAVLVITTGAVIFTSAEVITKQFLEPPAGSPVLRQCSCSLLDIEIRT